MNAKWVGIIATGAAVGLAPLVVVAQTRRSAPAQQPAATKKAANQQKARAAEERRLAVLYAQKSLELAKLNLENAQESNRRIARSVSPADIEQLRQTVKVAEQNLKSAQGAPSNPAVATAVANVQLAESNLRKAMTANQRVPNSITPVEMRRLQLNFELAQLTLARERSVGSDSASLIADLQWEVQQLRSQVANLEQRVDFLSAER